MEWLPCSCPAAAKSLPQLTTTCGKLQQRGLRAVDCFGGAKINRGEIRWCVNAWVRVSVCVGVWRGRGRGPGTWPGSWTCPGATPSARERSGRMARSESCKTSDGSAAGVGREVLGDSPHSGKCRRPVCQGPRSCLSPKSERQHTRAQRGEKISFRATGHDKLCGDENAKPGSVCERAASLTGRGASCSPKYPLSQPPAAGATIWVRRRVPRFQCPEGYYVVFLHDLLKRSLFWEV